MNYVSQPISISGLCVATTAFAKFATLKNAIKSSRRLNKCLNGFQKIENKLVETLPRKVFIVHDVFVEFRRQGHSKKNALLLTKMTIRGNISPYVSTYDLSLLQMGLQWKEQAFLQKEVKNVPHYRDIEFKHKKKRF